ncbi:MAG: carboxypeptidase regulatory-like domain-containing protein [Anaerolineales bacterium]|nr:MAG: carboxypeptidase regulatory-like domain-containing protein [Anaerolineales bacterium]
MDTNSRPNRRKHRSWLIAAPGALLLVCLALGLALRTEEGSAFMNVAEYRLRVAWWSLVGKPEYDPDQTGSLSGVIRNAEGQPLADAVVLVATLRGQVYQARSDKRGRYRIDGVPPGRYVPLAAAWGYEETTREPVQVVRGRVQRNLDFVLPRYWPVPVEPTHLQIGPSQPASCTFPTPLVASRTPFTFTLDGLTINGGHLYLPADAPGPLPTLLIVYPSAPLNWDATSVALTRDGFAVLAIGPDADRGLDVEGHVRDLRATFQLWQEGRLEPSESMTVPIDSSRWVLMSGSFGSLIVFRALRDLPPVPAIVDVGGVSDAFLVVGSLYSEDLKIPPPYDSAIAAMGRPDRDPAFFFAFSPVFFADRLPPVLIVHTYADEVIPYSQAVALDVALAEAGTPHELFLYEDTTHYLDAYNPTQATFLVYERVVAFAKEHVR